MSEDRTYNGWASYETWAVALWLDNEKGDYLYWREQAEKHWKNALECERVVKGIWTREEAATFNLADQLRDEIRENSPLQASSMYSDLLTSALDEVNWREIAGNWLEDWIEAAEKEKKEAEAEKDKEENDKAEKEKEPDRWPIISSYTRTQAISDGVLVDVSKLAGEAGIRYPVALTSAVWERYVKLPKKARGQDETGRLWDILSMLRIAIKGSGITNQINFSVIIKNGRRTQPVRFKAICGPGDSAEPVITIMLPEED